MVCPVRKEMEKGQFYAEFKKIYNNGMVGFEIGLNLDKTI